MATCPNCGNQTAEGAIFCDRCGARIVEPGAAVPEAPAVAETPPAPAGGGVICAACGAGNVPGEAFCDYCGAPLEAPAPAVEAVAELEAASTEAELEAATQAPPAQSEVEAGAPAGEPPAEPICPVCGAAVLPGEAFCSDCGASLAQPPIPPEPVAEEPPVEEAEVAAEAEVAVPPAPGAPEAAPLPVQELVCPVCGAAVEAGDKFCSNCGAAVEGAPATAETAAPSPPPPIPAAGPRLVVVPSGAEIPLVAGEEILIGREDPVSGIFPDVDLTPHGGEDGGVSRRHARIIVEGDRFFIEDLDSTNFTFVNKQKLAPKTRQPLNDGDEIRCGRVALVLKAS